MAQNEQNPSQWIAEFVYTNEKWQIPIIIRVTGIKGRLKSIEFVQKCTIPENSVNNEVITQLRQIFEIYFRSKQIDHVKIWKQFNFESFFDSAFVHNVLYTTGQIPIGQTKSYQEIGKIINSRGYQAIGSALRHNPFPILIPCHRVVSKNPKNLGGFMGSKDQSSWELTVKRQLLEFEKD